MKRPFPVLILLLLWSGIAPERAHAMGAGLACSDAGVMDWNPRYIGRSASGASLYVCRGMLMGRPPYPVVACYNSFQCTVAGYTY